MFSIEDLILASLLQDFAFYQKPSDFWPWFSHLRYGDASTYKTSQYGAIFLYCGKPPDLRICREHLSGFQGSKQNKSAMITAPSLYHLYRVSVFISPSSTAILFLEDCSVSS